MKAPFSALGVTLSTQPSQPGCNLTSVVALRFAWFIAAVLLVFPAAGSTFKELFAFTPKSNPIGGLVSDGNGGFYGVTQNGGTNLLGSIFHADSNAVISTLFSFNGTNGATPVAGLLLGQDGALYGTTSAGGSNGNFGTVFRCTTAGALTSLFSFSSNNGASPRCALIQSPGGMLYGTTFGGGTLNRGTVFRIDTNGGFTSFFSFNGTNGFNPACGLVRATNGDLYGVTQLGGPSYQITNFPFKFGNGTVFRVDTNDTVFPNVFIFTNTVTTGLGPKSVLCVGPDGALYGTTSAFGDGHTVFRLTTDTNFSVLYNFNVFSGPSDPDGGLTLGLDGNLYGTTSFGGDTGAGILFQITTGGAFTVVASFAATNGLSPASPLFLAQDGSFYGLTTTGGSDNAGVIYHFNTNLSAFASFPNVYGSAPLGALTPGADGKLYGTTSTGGTNGGFGSVFQISNDGTLNTLASFSGALNGSTPSAELMQGLDGAFYGTAVNGGTYNNGTVFRITTNGTITPLVSFDGTNGANPFCGLYQDSNGVFYGCTAAGGTNGGFGTIFSLTTNGALASLFSFNQTNGERPLGRLVPGPGGKLFGVTSRGGPSIAGWGTFFRISPQGSLDSFINFPAFGIYPGAPLTPISSSNFLGVTQGAVNTTNGTIYLADANGAQSLLFVCTPATGTPNTGLIRGADGNYYGTTTGIGTSNAGTLFRFSTNGNFSTIYTFNGPNGSNPRAGLVAGSDGALYGTTSAGGSHGGGNVFRLETRPVIQSIVASNNNFNITWDSMPGATYQLQYSTNITQTNWNNLGGTLFATNLTWSATDTLPADSARYYRVVLLP